ncbi:hypothetical protein [Novosphingobium sp. AAP1]|uniref:hypothetical protein n=1 Tax=Novosphingobium sp. AAP1 TaxID=1523413 RepID=UPI0012E210A2|nr:hypothetical protein [Novosphingobium sp. AAP1]
MDDFDRFARAATALLGGEAEVTVRQGRRAEYPGSPREAADLFVKKLGFTPIGDGWVDLGEKGSDPAGYLTNILKRDLVGHNIDWLPDGEARNCSEGFYSLFKGPAVTNLANVVGNEWNPITTSTVEAAYVSMDDDRIGLFLLEAED